MAAAGNSGTSIDGKVALITGAGQGLGRVEALALAAAGARVVVNDLGAGADRVCAEIRDAGGEATAAPGDVGDWDFAAGLVGQAISTYGRLDILVNNAGTTQLIPHADLDAATDEVWDKILSTNLMGTWHMTRSSVPALKASGAGSVINVTSVAGLRQAGSSIPYAVSKAGINHLTRLLANVLGPEIRVNAVAPGLVDTPWTADWAAARERVTAQAPLKRPARPEDVAEAIMGLVLAGFVTGQVVTVDGGMSLR
jgi:ketoreductase RED2